MFIYMVNKILQRNGIYLFSCFYNGSATTSDTYLNSVPINVLLTFFGQFTFYYCQSSKGVVIFSSQFFYLINILIVIILIRSNDLNPIQISLPCLLFSTLLHRIGNDIAIFFHLLTKMIYPTKWVILNKFFCSTKRTRNILSLIVKITILVTVV
mgnify:CR=1 FL=1